MIKKEDIKSRLPENTITVIPKEFEIGQRNISGLDEFSEKVSLITLAHK